MSVAVQVLLTLARRSRTPGRIGSPVFTFATPAAPVHVPCGPDTYAVTPGPMRRGPLTSRSSIRCSSGRSPPAVGTRTATAVAHPAAAAQQTTSDSTTGTSTHSRGRLTSILSTRIGRESITPPWHMVGDTRPNHIRGFPQPEATFPAQQVVSRRPTAHGSIGRLSPRYVLSGSPDGPPRGCRPVPDLPASRERRCRWRHE